MGATVPAVVSHRSEAKDGEKWGDMEDEVFWNGRWYPQAMENDGTITTGTPDAYPLHTTTLPHLLPNLDDHFPCACACTAATETEMTRPGYLEELGWRQGIGLPGGEKTAGEKTQKKRVSFSEDVEVKDVQVSGALRPHRKRTSAEVLHENTKSKK